MNWKREKIKDRSKLIFAVLVLGAFLLFYLCGCSSYARDLRSPPPKPAMKPTSVSKAVRFVLEREGDPSEPFDNTENIFHIPEEMKYGNS